MLHRPRWPRIVLSVAIGSTLLFNVNGLFARQAEQPPAPTPATKPAQAEAAPVDPALQSAVDDFWHYAKIARYDLANAKSAEILSHQDQAGQVLRAFEKPVLIARMISINGSCVGKALPTCATTSRSS